MPQPEPPIRDGAPRIRADSLPPLLRWVVWLLAAQAVGLVAVVVFLIIEDVNASGPSRQGGLSLTAFVILMTAILGVLSWALSRRRAWARSPAIVLELLLVPVGYYMVTGGLALVGLAVIAIGLAGAGSLLAPSTRAALGAE